MTLPLEQSMEGGMSNQGTAMNTDRELWREPTDQVGMEYYQPSIHVTKRGGIGINVGGTVIVKSLRDWHALAMPEFREAVRAARTRELAAAGFEPEDDISQSPNGEARSSVGKGAGE